jgi:WD40 repeat protein
MNPVCAAVAADPPILAVSDDSGHVFVRQVFPSYKKLYDFRVATGGPVYLSCDHAGRRLAVSSPQGPLRILELSSGGSLAEYDVGKAITALALSASGKMVALATTDHRIRILDAQTGEEIRSYSHHAGTVNAISYSPDDKYLVTCSSDKTFILMPMDPRNEKENVAGTD